MMIAAEHHTLWVLGAQPLSKVTDHSTAHLSSQSTAEAKNMRSFTATSPLYHHGILLG
jgi:hypothetical protein